MAGPHIGTFYAGAVLGVGTSIGVRREDSGLGSRCLHLQSVIMDTSHAGRFDTFDCLES